MAKRLALAEAFDIIATLCRGGPPQVRPYVLFANMTDNAAVIIAIDRHPTTARDGVTFRRANCQPHRAVPPRVLPGNPRRARRGLCWQQSRFVVREVGAGVGIGIDIARYIS